jgi:hypothetical protein
MAHPSIESLLPDNLEHPRLYFKKEETDLVREMCLEGTHSEVFGQKRQQLDLQLAQAFPCPPPREQSYRNGIWEEYSRLSSEARTLVTDYALAYVVDQNPAYLEKAWEGVSSVMNWPSWVHPVHEFMQLDLDGSHTNVTLASVYDLLYHNLTDNQRREIEFMVYTRGLSHCIGGMAQHFWADRYDSNWCSVCVSNMGLVAITMLDANALHLRINLDAKDAMTEIIGECIERLNRFYDHIEEDGSWKEGPGYWNYGISTSMPFSDALKRLTSGKVNLFSHPKLRSTIEFPINCFLPPDRVVNFADCGKSFPGGMAYRKFAVEHSNAAASYFDILTTGGKPSLGLSELFWDASSVESRLPEPDHPSAYFPAAGWCIQRSSWSDPDATILALKIGATVEPHGHADVGNYIIHTHGKTVIRELGIGRYADPGEWIFKDTDGHNLPLFDGKGQPRDIRLEGAVLESHFSETHDFLKAEIGPAYGLDFLETFTRSYLYIRPDVFLVLDRIGVSETTHMESRIHISGKVNPLDGHIELQNEGVNVGVKLILPQDMSFAQDRHTGLKPGHADPESQEVDYLKLEMDLPRGTTTVAVAFGIDIEPNVALELEGQSYLVTSGDQQFKI